VGYRIAVASAVSLALAVGLSPAGGQVHFVTVNNNFFSPAELTIAVGDTVQWTNSSGFHNVFSCNPGQFGCDGAAATETFTSGAPADPLWIYSYTFTQPGSNPYICQPHAGIMSGMIEVEGPPLGPPPVPDGVTGIPMIVAKLDVAGTALEIGWDTDTCPGAVNHQILFGALSTLPDDPGGIYQLTGSECAIGTISPMTWNPPASAGLLWWVIVATNGATREGAWGDDSAGQGRTGPGPGGSSGACGIAGKDLSNSCTP